MLFSGLTFLYCFLPAVLAAYFLAPKHWKNAVLLVSSLIFYAWGEPRYVLLMVLTILGFYFCGIAISRGKTLRVRQFWLWVSLALGLGALGIFKYADFFIGSLNAVTALPLPLLRLTLPIGISFYTFQCISYTVDVYRQRALPQKNLITFGAYVCLFPQLIAGPIVRYTDVARELESRTHSWEDFALGLRRFLFGLGKKVLLANQFGELTEAFRNSGEKSVLFVWLYALAYALQIYFDFSGYSDMAIGLGRILGFRFPENFNYPYLSSSVTEFWRRWHMTLGGWFRDYVYIPLGGNRVSKLRWVFNILVVWMLTGLWHGASWNFVVWGLLFALLLLLEKMVPGLKRLPRGAAQLYVLLVVVLSFVVFNAQSLQQAGQDLAGMLGLGGLPGTTVEALYALRSNAVLLVVGMVGATPWPKQWAQKIGERVPLLEALAMGALLLLCTAYLVDGSFNPFLYFRF
ncbi:MAG: MBOAT family protein [Firmicutes bacterium]|nr:MBOAT family protein [Bacillota bacterium]MDY6161609.1 MBOAT family O-acyltransferase [Candidatus Faecousia sp.]